MIRRLPLAVLAALALILTTLAMPASAKPGQVTSVWAKASSSTSITLDWNGTSGSKKYQVFYSTTYAGAGSLDARSTYTSGSTSELKITGLKPGTMYCFAVRGVGSGNGARSPRHCKFTMRRENNTSLPTARVATFNVCSNAGSCASTWKSRQAAIVERIRLTQAEVVLLQESSGKMPEMQAALAPLGFALGSRPCGSEAVYYRTDVFEQVDDVLAPQSSCRDTTRRPQSGGGGSFYLDHEADAAWARLVLKRTGDAYVFVSAHLTNGKDKQAEVDRYVETRHLIKHVKALTPSIATHRVIIGGDLNSHRNRASDTPRRELEKEGWYDTYDRSATFTYPRYNSYAGWGTTPTTSQTYGDHVDHVFVQDEVGSTTWRVQHVFVSGRYATPVPSDHTPVRVTLYLP